MKKNKKGFTLIEVLVVVAIVVILASMAFMFYGVSRTKSRDSVRKSDLREIQNALNLYIEDNQTYPENLLELSGSYLNKLPNDPSTDSDYLYAVSSNGNRYELNAILELNHDEAAQIDGGNESFPIYEVGTDLYLLP